MPRGTSCRAYISQLILFARTSSQASDCNKCIYKGWKRDKAPPVSAVIDIHREL